MLIATLVLIITVGGSMTVIILKAMYYALKIHGVSKQKKLFKF